MPEHGGPRIPKGVQEGIYSGECMDILCAHCRPIAREIRRVIIISAQHACWVDGFQEFLFDLLTNFPEVDLLSIELSCLDGFEGDTLMGVLRQFCEVYPDREVCLDARDVQAVDPEYVICNFSAGDQA